MLPSPTLDFHITNLAAATALASEPRGLELAGVVQLLTPTEGVLPSFSCPKLHLPCGDRNLTERDSFDAPTHDQVLQLLKFGRSLPPDGAVLFHCYSGKSRSAAAALIVLTDRFGPKSERVAARIVSQRYPSAEPNLVLLCHADDILRREGALVAAGEILARAKREAGMPGNGWLV